MKAAVIIAGLYYFLTQQQTPLGELFFLLSLIQTMK
jgi:hypothetical protein